MNFADFGVFTLILLCSVKDEAQMSTIYFPRFSSVEISHYRSLIFMVLSLVHIIALLS
jgi:hypothetical protein